MGYEAIPKEKIFDQKIGNSFVWSFGYLTSLDLTDYSIRIEGISKLDGNTELFSVDSGTPTDNEYITTDLLAQGKFSLVIKNTSNFTEGDYYVDVSYTSPEGIKQSTNAIVLRMKKRF